MELSHRENYRPVYMSPRKLTYPKFDLSLSLVLRRSTTRQASRDEAVTRQLLTLKCKPSVDFSYFSPSLSSSKKINTLSGSRDEVLVRITYNSKVHTCVRLRVFQRILVLLTSMPSITSTSRSWSHYGKKPIPQDFTSQEIQKLMKEGDV